MIDFVAQTPASLPVLPTLPQEHLMLSCCPCNRHVLWLDFEAPALWLSHIPCSAPAQQTSQPRSDFFRPLSETAGVWGVFNFVWWRSGEPFSATRIQEGGLRCVWLQAHGWFRLGEWSWDGPREIITWGEEVLEAGKLWPSKNPAKETTLQKDAHIWAKGLSTQWAEDSEAAHKVCTRFANSHSVIFHFLPVLVKRPQGMQCGTCWWSLGIPMRDSMALEHPTWLHPQRPSKCWALVEECSVENSSGTARWTATRWH